ncbi:MAG: hypothetical protein EBQ75_03480, partial [Actinobacteria bacterium]|nr:hypothetical protein [Actinomycetota bacterium]
QDRWITVLEAVAFSPVRSSVKPAAIPAQPSEALLATVKRLAPLIPHIAAMFGVAVEAGASAPNRCARHAPTAQRRNRQLHEAPILRRPSAPNNLWV